MGRLQGFGIVTVFGVTIVHNEQDILGRTVRHLLDQGVEHIIAIDHRSSDATLEVLMEIIDTTGRLEVWHDHDRYFHQERLTNEMAAAARARGADWILPFDADEFWVPSRQHQELTLAKAFSVADELRCDTVWAPVFQHRDAVWRLPQAQIQGKLAIRAEPVRSLLIGNHRTEPDGRSSATSLLQIREVPFRSEAHFVRKMRARLETMRPDADPGEHVQYRECVGLSDGELAKRYHEFCAQAVCVDPIPSLYAR